jgi:hypothetical protein
MLQKMLSRNANFVRLFWRILVVFLSASLAWATGVGAIVNITSDSNPDVALSFVGDEPNALTAKLDAALSKTKTSVDQRVLLSSAGNVKKALVGQVINPRGLRQLALIADANTNNSNVEEARVLMALSTKLSRRDFAAQLWLIEDGVRANNIVSTMRQYDMALRTSAESTVILYPILSAALVDDEVRRAFIPYFRANPPWLVSFLSFAINGGASPVAMAQTILDGGGIPNDVNYRPFHGQLLQQLAAKGAFTEAFQYYARLEGRFQPLPTSTAFEKATIDPDFAPLSWQLQSSPGVEALFEPVGKSGAQQLHVIVNSGERAPVVRKLMGFSPGTYRFSQKMIAARLSNGASAYWQLLCLQDSDRILIWQSNLDSAKIEIPTECKGQYLELVVAGGANQDGAELTVQSVLFSRI